MRSRSSGDELQMEGKQMLTEYGLMERLQTTGPEKTKGNFDQL